MSITIEILAESVAALEEQIDLLLSDKADDLSDTKDTKPTHLSFLSVLSFSPRETKNTKKTKNTKNPKNIRSPGARPWPGIPQETKTTKKIKPTHLGSLNFFRFSGGKLRKLRQLRTFRDLEPGLGHAYTLGN